MFNLALWGRLFDRINPPFLITSTKNSTRYEHIIRDEIDLQNKTNYIDANPRLWNKDDNNPNI